MNVFQEDEVTEFKRSTGELKVALASIVAMLNKHGHGKLYFGIKDDGTVVGQTVTGKTLRDVSHAIEEKIEPKIYPDVRNVFIEDKECIIVEFEGLDRPYMADGRYYIRVSDEDQRLTSKEIKNIIMNNSLVDEKWDRSISDKTVDDVNEQTLKDYIKRGNDADRIPFEYTNKEDVLKRLGLIKNDKLLNAAKVLFCDDNEVNLQMAVFATDSKTTFIDIEKKSSNVFDLIKMAQEYIRSNIIWRVEIHKRREEIPEIPLEAIREVIINSFVHKLYPDPKGVEISIFKDRVEVYNPGEFPEEYTPFDYINDRAHSVLRNPLIADIMYKSKDVETYSSGFKRINEECQYDGVKFGFRKEKIGFVMIIYRKDFNKDYTGNVSFPTLEEREELGLQSVFNFSSYDDKINRQNVGVNLENGEIHRRFVGVNSENDEINRQNVGVNSENDGIKFLVSDEGLTKLTFTQLGIINLIAQNEEITQQEMANQLGITKRTVERNINVLKDKGLIKRIGSDKNGVWNIDILRR